MTAPEDTPGGDGAGCVVVIGGTSGLGLEICRHFAATGSEVVLTGRDPERAAAVAAEIGPNVRGCAVDLGHPEGIAAGLAGVGRVEHLVLSAIDRDQNTATDYNVQRALYLVTLKLVGYTEVVHVLRTRLNAGGSVLLFGGRAKDRPYPGSTTVSTVNGGVVGMVNALATELAPIRVNAIHPGIVGDSPYWSARPPEVLDAVRARTPTGRVVAMADVVDAAVFLLRNRSVNGENLSVDGGWLLM